MGRSQGYTGGYEEERGYRNEPRYGSTTGGGGDHEPQGRYNDRYEEPGYQGEGGGGGWNSSVSYMRMQAGL